MYDCLEGKHDDVVVSVYTDTLACRGFLFTCPSHTSSELVRQLPQGPSLQEFGLILVVGGGRERKSEGRPRVEPVDENGRHPGLHFLKVIKGNSELQSSSDSLNLYFK